MEVYKRVRAFIEANGYKQLAVAQKAGISNVTFNAMMNGKRIMYADDLRAICLALNVSPEVFIEIPKSVKCKGVIQLNNIKKVAQSVLQMDKYMRDIIALQNNSKAKAMLWENTYIKKQIDKRKNGGVFTINDHIKGMVYSMLTSGASWKRMLEITEIETGEIPIIDEIFKHYDTTDLLNSDPQSIVSKLICYKLGTPYLKNQTEALIKINIGKLISIEKDYGCIDNFYKLYIDNDITMKSLVRELSVEGKPHKYTQLGIPLTAEYLRNVGYDIAKPDRHICRILGKDILGCSDKEEVPIFEAFDIVSSIANEIKSINGKEIHTAEVDYILWSYCANGYGQICTKNNPKCEVCVINNCNKK